MIPDRERIAVVRIMDTLAKVGVCAEDGDIKPVLDLAAGCLTYVLSRPVTAEQVRDMLLEILNPPEEETLQ